MSLLYCEGSLVPDQTGRNIGWLQHISTSCIGSPGSQSQLSRQVHASAKASIFLGILLPTKAFLSAASFLFAALVVFLVCRLGCIGRSMATHSFYRGHSNHEVPAGFFGDRSRRPLSTLVLLQNFDYCQARPGIYLEICFPGTFFPQMHSSSALVPRFFTGACLVFFFLFLLQTRQCHPLAKPKSGT